jgi:hypothetical protein
MRNCAPPPRLKDTMLTALATASFDYSASTNSPVATFIAIIIGLILLIAFFRIFQKAGKPGWAIIIPIFNTYVLLKIVGRPGWWLILLLIPFVNIVVGIIVMLDLARAFGRSPLFGVFGLILFPYVGTLILGFGKDTYRGDPQKVLA